MEPLDDTNEKNKELLKNRVKNAAYFIGFSTVVGVTAGVVAAKIAKKKSLEYYKDMNIVEAKPSIESPTHLAFRALAWSAVYSVGACSIAVICALKWFNISSLDDLRTKVRTFANRNHKPSEGRTEFESFSDFLRYLNESSGSK
ncbi:hypothetical protein RUM44_013577 [Polyplax serrata]|uniref:Transmembrane protein 242 n=1 Tax=Polyplax serrata TaxID=468196 RepID=A0ABR1BIG3_POLSC